jgi:hypothetical protein
VRSSLLPSAAALGGMLVGWGKGILPLMGDLGLEERIFDGHVKRLEMDCETVQSLTTLFLGPRL